MYQILPNVLHLYQHGREFVDVAARFCCAGLEDGECCAWVTGHPWNDAVALHEMNTRLSTTSQYVESGQLHIIPHEAWLPAGRELDSKMMRERASVLLRDAFRRGWSRVRACGEAFQPLPREDWGERLRYEEWLHAYVRETDLLVLCAYRRSRVAPLVQPTLAQHHHAILIAEDARWRCIPSAAQ